MCSRSCRRERPLPWSSLQLPMPSSVLRSENGWFRVGKGLAIFYVFDAVESAGALRLRLLVTRFFFMEERYTTAVNKSRIAYHSISSKLVKTRPWETDIPTSFTKASIYLKDLFMPLGTGNDQQMG
ncbi:unnamed protein product, partial [Ceratitis capitata]